VLSPEVGAVCINSARTDLWRGRLVRGVPTPTTQRSRTGRRGSNLLGNYYRYKEHFGKPSLRQERS
jgi:hypothetical protein